jgi:predicted nucleotidyltransferase
MNRNDILNRLRERREEISERFVVDRLGLFGSAKRDELCDDSDVDVL